MTPAIRESAQTLVRMICGWCPDFDPTILCQRGATHGICATCRARLAAIGSAEQVTLVRAHENLVAAASANRVGSSHGSEWAGGSVICAPQFPGFPVTLARADSKEGVITAVVDFAEIAKWYDLLPWREWRAGPQRPVSRLIADELAALSTTS